MTSPLILASTSTYRKQLLERLRIPFATVAPDVDETALPGELPQDLAERLSLDKATRVSIKEPEAIVIGSDQVCVLDGMAVGKPGTESVAVKQLMASSGKALTSYTGVCVVAPGHRPLINVVTTTVKMRTLSEAEIRRYVALDMPTDCAGSFKWERLGVALFESIEGCDPTALAGLPLIALCNQLRQVGLDPLDV
ncbi:MAG: nucleoside triphosphate pyrophosphatase [Pseudomonadota bacterium]